MWCVLVLDQNLEAIAYLNKYIDKIHTARNSLHQVDVYGVKIMKMPSVPLITLL
jgi:hypothetical protein